MTHVLHTEQPGKQLGNEAAPSGHKLPVLLQDPSKRTLLEDKLEPLIENEEALTRLEEEPVTVSSVPRRHGYRHHSHLYCSSLDKFMLPLKLNNTTEHTILLRA